MRFDDLSCYREAQARTLRSRVCLIVGLEEFLEDVRKLLRRDSNPAVVNGDGDLRADSFHSQLHRPAPVSELESVGQEVSQHFVDPVLVPEYVRWKIVAAYHAK